MKAMENTANLHDPGTTLPSHASAAVLHHHVQNLGLERTDLTKMPELPQPPVTQFVGKGRPRKPVHGADRYKPGRPKNLDQGWREFSGVWSWPETGTHEIMTQVLDIFDFWIVSDLIDNCFVQVMYEQLEDLKHLSLENSRALISGDLLLLHEENIPSNPGNIGGMGALRELSRFLRLPPLKTSDVKAVFRNNDWSWCAR